MNYSRKPKSTTAFFFFFLLEIIYRYIGHSSLYTYIHGANYVKQIKVAHSQVERGTPSVTAIYPADPSYLQYPWTDMQGVPVWP